MSNYKQSSVIHIRNWVRTNGDMSEDGKSITYSCKELEAIIAEAKEMEKQSIKDAFIEGDNNGFDYYNKTLTSEDYYNETYGGKK